MDMPRASFDTWLRNTCALSLEDGVLTVGARNSYARDWLDSRLKSTIKSLLVGIMSAKVEIVLVAGFD